MSFRRVLRKWLANHRPDILPGDTVVAIWGGPAGWVKDTSGDCATVWWHTHVGRYEIIQLNYLRKCRSNPSTGLDVRR